MEDSLTLAAGDYELFGLPERFTIEATILDEKWKALQSVAHPDRFAAEGAAAQRLAVQWSVRINEAYRRLKDPLTRAAYLCTRHGVDMEARRHTAMSGVFLAQQMSWRESLAEAGEVQEVEAIAHEVGECRELALQKLQTQIDGTEPVDWHQVACTVHELMFIDRFLSDIDRRFETLQP